MDEHCVCSNMLDREAGEVDHIYHHRRTRPKEREPLFDTYAQPPPVASTRLRALSSSSSSSKQLRLL